MVRNQKPLLPPHKHYTTVSIAHSQVWLLQLMLDVSESGETLPVNHILLLVGTPFLCQKSILVADDFCIEICGEFWPVVGQTPYAEIAAKEGR